MLDRRPFSFLIKLRFYYRHYSESWYINYYLFNLYQFIINIENKYLILQMASKHSHRSMLNRCNSFSIKDILDG